METRVVSIERPDLFRAAVAEAARILEAGGVVAVPTETVYGLAANALNAEAVAKIYDAKGRPAHNPIIVHVASIDGARRCVADWPPAAQKLASAFWPGPLTMVLPKSVAIPFIVTANGPTVGIRWPSHPFMQQLLQTCGFPIAAPSANRANEISPTSAEHVLKSLRGRVPLIVDAGASPVGIESTVVDLSRGAATVLRPGMISTEQIREVLQRHELTVSRAIESPEPLRSPGLLKRHYAPKAPAVVLEWNNDAELESKASSFRVPLEKVHVIAHEQIPRATNFGRVAVVPHDPEAYARALYSELHTSDSLGAKLILIEAVPESPAWEGIRDRLNRASAGN